MPIFPFMDDEARRRSMLTPGINGALPDVAASKPMPKIGAPTPGPTPTMMPGKSYPSTLPEAPPSRPALALPRAEAGGFTPAPESLNRVPQPPSRYEQMQEAKDVYLQGTPGRLKSGLLGALRGGLQGLATGGLGGALGGALAGGGFGAINPRGRREMEFNEQVRPKILERFGYEDADRAAAIAQAKAAGEQAMNRAQLANIQSQINSRAAQDALNQQKADMEANQPMTLSPGATVYDRKGQRALFTAPAAEKQPTQAELSIEPSSGKSAEEISDDSYAGRGGDQYVFDRLPERTRQLLSGEIANASPAELMAAQRTFENAIKKEKSDILQYTRGEVRSRALGARKGRSTSAPAPRQGQPGRRVISVAEGDELLK